MVDFPAEDGEFTDQLEQQTKATLAIYQRLCKSSSAFSERAEKSDYHQHWGDGNSSGQKFAASDIARVSLA